MMLSYEQALAYIHSYAWTKNPPGLDRIRSLCGALGDPQDKLQFIHVAGTNGKGSFCSMMTSVLLQEGYRVGTFTSPFLLRFNERICCNGVPIPDGDLCRLTETVRQAADKIVPHPGEFELTTAIALLYYEQSNCDFVVWETGMGGRLDPTNVIPTAVLSVITGISLDHTQYLGTTIAEIAWEKAGIIKRSRPVIFGGIDREAAEVIKRRADELAAPLTIVSYEDVLPKHAVLGTTVFDVGNRKDLEIHLSGLYQPANAALVVKAIDVLKKVGVHISERSVREGLISAVWPARFEPISERPVTIFDGGHNPEGIRAALLSADTYFPGVRPVVLCGMMRDKDVHQAAHLICERTTEVFLVRPDSPRSISGKDFSSLFLEYGVVPKYQNSVHDALLLASRRALELSVPLLVIGSLYLYREIRDELKNSDQ